MADRVMPHNLEAEQSVLGSMFLSKYAAEKCMESLQKELFYSEAHGRIFQAMSDLVEAGKALDITTLTAELDRKKWLSQVGGVEYISELVNIVPSAANIDQYIAIVEENAIKRRLIEEATQIVTDGYQSTEQLSDLLDRAEMKILNVVKTRKGTEFRSIQDVLFKAQQDLEKLAQTKGEVTGLSTGFYDIDKLDRKSVV